MRKLVCAMFAMSVSFGVAFAEDYRATITKVEGNKVTFQKYKGERGSREKDGDPITISVSSSVKVAKGKFSKGDDGKFKIEVGEALEGGLKNAKFKDIGEKGVRARITTDADNKTITQILTTEFGGGGFKGGKGNKGKKKTDAN